MPRCIRCTRLGTTDDLNFRGIPSHILSAEDASGPRRQTGAFFPWLPEPNRLRRVLGADRFFTGELEKGQADLGAFLRDVLDVLSGKGRPTGAGYQPRGNSQGKPR